ncbi:hypothetical protein [Streptomyces sp. AcH 505]|uniref:hypothetical protein n=1 Tax=Streptomyces sp. AcH 505 TaxID=352211 RepID=UPI0005A76BEB
MDDPKEAPAPTDLIRLGDTLRALPPSCGPVRLVAVDGHAGSGKSTFADRLSAALGDAPVLRLDDLASHEQLFDWTDRFAEQVTGPLSRGASARYAPYDWTARRFLPPRTLAPAPVVLVEGVGAGRRALRPLLARLFWMDRDAEASWQRGRRRDGPEQSAFWDDWIRAETSHFAADPSVSFADALVRETPEGYVVSSGTDVTPGEHSGIT